MTYKKYNIHRFACDEDGCRNRLYLRVRSKRYAVSVVRDVGWSVPYPNECYCADHNTKDTDGVDDLPHNVTEDPPDVY